MNATEAFGLTEIARATVNGIEYVVASDEAFTCAVPAYAYDEVGVKYQEVAVPRYRETDDGDNSEAVDAAGEHNVQRYSLWCAGPGAGVGDEALCRAIAQAAGLDGIHTAGSCRYVTAVEPSDDE